MRKDATKPGGSEANPPRATGGPTLVRSPGKEFYDKLAPARTQAAKGEVKKSDSASVVEDLKSFTGGFDNELEAMLKLPPVLFWMEDSGARFYSSSESFGLSNVLLSLQAGELSLPDTTYGFMLYNRGTSVYFLFVDTERKVVVNDRLLSLHGPTGTENGWQPIKSKLKAALEMAASSGPDLYSVYDAGLKQMKHP
ncbi:MAG: hypothetical protein U0R44_03425 [Candidatus Micrarchaeia archaeon]